MNRADVPPAEPSTVTVSTYAEARDTYRRKELRQALYDEGGVIMSDVIVNLHGEDHRVRRRLENRLFRRSVVEHYEHERFPAIIESTMAPHLARGTSELVSLGHELMMNLAALTAGIDRPLGTPEETAHLYSYLTTFIEGATLAHYTGDRDAKRAEVQAALERFDDEFLAPSIERRRRALSSAEIGTAGDELPHDVLSVLMHNADKAPLTHETIRREIAFYLLAGAHTSATAFTRVTHNILTWVSKHPEDAGRVISDRRFVQQCVHETVRLQPSSPVAMRWALADVQIGGGRHIRKGDRVIIDLLAVNRDPTVFGDDADDFRPGRDIPDGVAPYGLAFGLGMHACIGQELAAGLVGRGDEPVDTDQFGLVAQAVQHLFDHGCTADDANPPQMDPSTTRPYFGSYPVRFDAQ